MPRWNVAFESILVSHERSGMILAEAAQTNQLTRLLIYHGLRLFHKICCCTRAFKSGKLCPRYVDKSAYVSLTLR